MISPVSLIANFGLQALKPSNSPALIGQTEQGVVEFANVLREGEAAAVKGVVGDVPMHQAVEKILEAERALQTAIAIRDKVVSAYLEVSRMQI